MNANTGAGVLLVLFYTVVMTAADAVTKTLSVQLSSAQFYAFGAAGVVVLTVIAALRSGHGLRPLRTAHPQMMFLRCCVTLAACLCFYQAFSVLYFAEVFLFIAFIPVLSSLFAGLMLHEKIGPWHIGGLTLSVMGAGLLFAPGTDGALWGYGFAGGATIFSALSLVIERWLALRENRLLAQLFYPYSFVAIVMSFMLPLSWQPMTFGVIGLLIAYSGMVFLARSLSIMALRNMAAAAVTPMMNLQFIWMVICGVLFFAEWPSLTMIWGAGLVALSGAMCVHGSHQKPSRWTLSQV